MPNLRYRRFGTIADRLQVVAITPKGDVVTMLGDPDGMLARNPTNVGSGGEGQRGLWEHHEGLWRARRRRTSGDKRERIADAAV